MSLYVVLPRCLRLWRTASAVPWNHSFDPGVCSAARMDTKPCRKRSKRYACAICRLRLAELNCVRTKIRSIPELIQLEIGTSMSRYFPARGTAGFDRRYVRGKRRVPAPPPNITASTSFIFLDDCSSSVFRPLPPASVVCLKYTHRQLHLRHYHVAISAIRLFDDDEPGRRQRRDVTIGWL